MPSAHADNYLVNSKDWKDVFSIMLYGKLSGNAPYFLVSQQHARLIQSDIPKDVPLHIVTSENPYLFGVETIFSGNGYDADEQVIENVNLGLADQLADVTGFIVIDDSYGYNAVSVAPYAVLKGYYVIFADRNNVDDVANFLSQRTIDKLIIYGQVDRDVLESLTPYNPEIINDGGDRFANNLAIVDKFLEEKGETQVIMTNGEFLEQSLIDDQFPTIFIGRENVPDSTRQFLKDRGITIGVLIGNDLVGTATYLRRALDMNIFVKFARSARTISGPVSQVEGLDIFYLPKYDLSLDISSIRYNKVTKQLEVTFQNPVDVAIYLKGTYDIRSGEDAQTVGDLDTIFIDGQDTKTVVYDVEPLAGTEISVKASVLFGESKNSLEYLLEKEFSVETVEVLDDSDIDILKVVYDRSKGVFLITVQNIGTVDTFVDTEVFELSVDGVRGIYGADKIIKLSPGDTGVSEIAVELLDRDLEDNPKIQVRGYYGQREFSLIKTKEKTFDLVIKSFDAMTYVPIVAIVLLILLILFIRRRRKRKDGDSSIHGRRKIGF